MPRALVLALAVALLLATAGPAQAVDHDQAAKRALAALGSTSGTGPVVVFGLPKPVRAGTRVTQASRLILRVRGERAFFFYEDAGRVALVGASSARVRIARTTAAPLVNGRLPAFLTSVKRYKSAKYRVFSRSSSTAAAGGSVFESDTNELLAPLASFGANKAPKAEKQDVRVKKNSPKNITLTASDDEGDFLTYSITQPPDHGTLSGAPPELTYTPDLNYVGKDKVGFRARDDEHGANSNTAHVSIDIVPLGAAPAVAASAGCTAYTERAPSVVIDNLITASDPDDATLDSATVRVSANFVEGDALLFTDQNGISGSYDDVTEVLHLNGTSSVANYQAALRSVRYRNLASADPPPTKNIAFTVNDGGTNSAPATKQLCITDTPGGSRPVGEPSEGALQYTENDGQVPIDPGFSAFDPDSATLSGATIKFSPTAAAEDDEGNPIGDPTFNFFPDEDELLFTDQNGITGSYDDVNGVLTLSGTASVANYEAAIRSITYENSSEDPSEEARTIRFQLTDSSAATSVPTTRGILVTAVNDAPVITTSSDAATAIGENPSTTVDSGLTVIDVDDSDLEGAVVRISSGFAAGDELVFSDQNGISGSYAGGTGVLTLTGTASVADYEAALRTIEYSHPDGNPGGSRTVEFVVNDGDLDSGPTSRDVVVNDAPVLDTTDAALDYTAGDGAVPIDPGITVSDVDSTTLASATVHITENSAPEDVIAFTDQLGITGFFDEETGVLTLSGTASLTDYETALRSVTYENTSGTPSTATRTVTFQANDGETFNSQSEPATRDIEVSLPNEAPVVTTSAGSTTYVDGGSTVPVDSGVTVADADDTDLESAKVSISSGFESGDDLVYVNQLGISGGYDTGTGVLTLTGTASLADYETALRSVEFGHNFGPATGPKTVDFTVNDGDVDSAAATKTIDIVPSL